MSHTSCTVRNHLHTLPQFSTVNYIITNNIWRMGKWDFFICVCLFVCRHPIIDRVCTKRVLCLLQSCSNTFLFHMNLAKNYIANSSSMHKEYPEDQRPKRGRKYALRTLDELDVIQYTNFCWEVSILKTQKMLKPEVTHHLKVEGIENKFKHGEPGIFLLLSFLVSWMYPCSHRTSWIK